MIVTTNLKFADWTQAFKYERLAAALLDRLTHHAHILELVGESYHFRQRMDITAIAGSPAAEYSITAKDTAIGDAAVRGAFVVTDHWEVLSG
jgi:hypothetical protein